ncbi:hypothetical protein H5410_020719 [Solanum commersonii]|uniref:Uncharacterized protein n=1 Tax=Solanum commersonii TaxID=4109 RepID=A0A9J5ZF28_SOLCO|nr:hypothetical protein H5410_020719 [Solanum commersonii]
MNHKKKHTPKDIQEDVKRDLGVDINYMKAWRLKERAIKILRGVLTEALYPFINDFQHCMIIIVVDGAHLKGVYKGIFVSSSTLDRAGV